MNKIVISNEAIESIIVNAVTQVDGVLSTWKGAEEYVPYLKNDTRRPHGVEFSIDENVISITVFLVAKYGTNVKELGKEVQREVKSQIENITPFTVSEVNVIIEDIKDEG
ncbi:MAG: Asp23/Gls24 family envelope stress response protein [Caldisericaceae bacterium]